MKNRTHANTCLSLFCLLVILVAMLQLEVCFLVPTGSHSEPSVKLNHISGKRHNKKHKPQYIIAATLSGPSNQLFGLINALALALEYDNTKAVFTSIDPHFLWLNHCLREHSESVCRSENQKLNPRIVLNMTSTMIRNHVVVLYDTAEDRAKNIIRVKPSNMTICSSLGNARALDALVRSSAMVAKMLKILISTQILRLNHPYSYSRSPTGKELLVLNFSTMEVLGVVFEHSANIEKGCVRTALAAKRSVVLISNDHDICASRFYKFSSRSDAKGGISSAKQNVKSNTSRDSYVGNGDVDFGCMLKSSLMMLDRPSEERPSPSDDRNHQVLGACKMLGNIVQQGSEIFLRGKDLFHKLKQDKFCNARTAKHVQQSVFVHLRVPDALVAYQGYTLSTPLNEVFPGSLWMWSLLTASTSNNSNNSSSDNNKNDSSSSTCGSIVVLGDLIDAFASSANNPLSLATTNTITRTGTSSNSSDNFIAIISNSKPLKAFVSSQLEKRLARVFYYEDYIQKTYLRSYINTSSGSPSNKNNSSSSHSSRLESAVLYLEWLERGLAAYSAHFVYDDVSSFSTSVRYMRSGVGCSSIPMFIGCHRSYFGEPT